MRVFIDASVLFSALLSPTGSSRELLRRAQIQEVTLVISTYILAEVEQNLIEKAPQSAGLFKAIQQIVGFDTTEPTPEQVKAAAEYTEAKDAPVVAAAISANCEYLATFDRKHLINPPQVAQKSGLKIVTPDVIVNLLREQDEAGNNGAN